MPPQSARRSVARTDSVASCRRLELVRRMEGEMSHWHLHKPDLDGEYAVGEEVGVYTSLPLMSEIAIKVGMMPWLARMFRGEIGDLRTVLYFKGVILAAEAHECTDDCQAEYPGVRL